MSDTGKIVKDMTSIIGKIGGEIPEIGPEISLVTGIMAPIFDLIWPQKTIDNYRYLEWS